MQNLNIKLSEEERGASRNVGLSIRNMRQMRLLSLAPFSPSLRDQLWREKLCQLFFFNSSKKDPATHSNNVQNGIQRKWINLLVPSENSKIKGGSSEGEGKGEKNTAMSSWPRYCYHQDSLCAPFPL